MRVAVVTVDTPTLVDTARTRRLDRVAKQLAAHEHEVIVACTQWWDGSVSSFEQDGVRYQRVTSERSPRQFAARLPFVLRRIDPDVIHAGYWPPGAAASAGAGRWLAGTPAVVDWYGDEPVDLDRRSTRAALRWPRAILTPSRHVRTTVREFGTSAERTRIVPESIDVERINAVTPAAEPDIVTARRLDDEANVDMMLLGLAELRDRDWTATVIGDGPAKERYERKAAELRIADRVDFPGELPRDRRIAHYRAAHVFVQTAERCPFAIELLWALAAGCVGVVDYQEESAAHELVEAFERGFRTTDPEELSEAIREAGEKDEMTYDETFEPYDHERVLERYLDVYDEILA